MGKQSLCGFAGLCAYFLLFSDVHNHSFVAYDDLSYVVQNRFVRNGLSWEGVRWAFSSLNGGVSYWHPLTWVSHQIDVEIYGGDCSGHKLTNLFLHLYNGVLVYAMLRRLSHPAFVCYSVAGVFLCHPLHVESVVWVSERKDLLCAFFELLAFHSYLSYHENKRWKHYSGMCLWFACALMSKPMAVTFPCLVLLVEFWLRRSGGTKRGLGADWESGLSSVVPLFLMSFAVGGLTILAQRDLDVVPSLDELSLSYRFANAFTSYLIYSLQALVPLGLGPHYPYPRAFGPWFVLFGVTFFCAMSIWAFRAWRSDPVVGFGWAWYVIGLLPVIGLIQTSDQARADRYMYLPLVGLTLIGTSRVYRLHSRLPRGSAVCLVGMMFCFYSWMTWHRIGDWRDSVTLFSRALRVTENNAVMHFGLAQSLDWVNESELVLEHLLAAMEIEPENPHVHTALARFYSYEGRRRLERIHLEKAVAWGVTDPLLERRLAGVLSDIR